MWNFRVIEHTYESGDKWYSINEVFYPQDNDDNPNGYTPPISIISEGDDPEGWKESMKWTLEMMLKGLDKPPLKEEDL